MDPEAAVQVTDLSVTVPCTDAANCTEPPVVAEGEGGVSVSDVTVGVVGAAITVTVADADFVVSATLFAVTVSGPAGRRAVDASRGDGAARRLPGHRCVGGCTLDRCTERQSAADDG